MVETRVSFWGAALPFTMHHRTAIGGPTNPELLVKLYILCRDHVGDININHAMVLCTISMDEL